MPASLTADSTVIETATIEIKSLTIGGRQMTPSIFKQLHERPVINYAGDINGTPWGVVNYHPDQCAQSPEHLHIVWQCGEQLNRSYTRAPEVANIEHQAASLYVQALIADGLTRGDTHAGNVRAYRIQGARRAEAYFSKYGVAFRADIPLDFFAAYEGRLGYPVELDLRSQVVDALGGADLSPEEIAQRLPVEAYKKSWRSLNELQQLFIGR